MHAPRAAKALNSAPHQRRDVDLEMAAERQRAARVSESPGGAGAGLEEGQREQKLAEGILAVLAPAVEHVDEQIGQVR